MFKCSFLSAAVTLIAFIRFSFLFLALLCGFLFIPPVEDVVDACDEDVAAYGEAEHDELTLHVAEDRQRRPAARTRAPLPRACYLGLICDIRVDQVHQKTDKKDILQRMLLKVGHVLSIFDDLLRHLGQWAFIVLFHHFIPSVDAFGHRRIRVVPIVAVGVDIAVFGLTLLALLHQFRHFILSQFNF